MSNKIKEKSDKEIYDELLKYVESLGFCPNPDPWSKMYLMLKHSEESEYNGAQLREPLILSAWWATGILPKQIVFQEQLKWAYDHGQIKKIDEYLRSLSEDQWYK